LDSLLRIRIRTLLSVPHRKRSFYLTAAPEVEEQVRQELYGSHHDGEDENVDEVGEHDGGYVVGELVQHRPHIVSLVVPYQQPEIRRLFCSYENVDKIGKHDGGYVVGELVQHRPHIVSLVIPYQQPEIRKLCFSLLFV
jgi:hypothetical protein